MKLSELSFDVIKLFIYSLCVILLYDIIYYVGIRDRN